jgi:hypothetical protein
MTLMPTMLFSLIALTALPGIAQDRIVSTSPATSATLDLYEQPAAAEPARQVSVSEAGLPLTIRDKQAGFYQVQVAGKDYWVKGAKVRVSRETTATCGAVAQGSSILTAATPGAGKDACK